MSRVLSAIWALLALGFALPVLAAEGDADYFARCEAEVRERYLTAVEVKLVSLRRRGSAVSVKVAVRQSGGESSVERVEFTSCRVSLERSGGNPGGEVAESPGADAERPAGTN